MVQNKQFTHAATGPGQKIAAKPVFSIIPHQTAAGVCFLPIFQF
jgi:hypothetical protein